MDRKSVLTLSSATLLFLASSLSAAAPTRRLLGPFLDTFQTLPLENATAAVQTLVPALDAFALDETSTGPDRVLVSSKKTGRQVVQVHSDSTDGKAFWILWKAGPDWSTDTCRFEIEGRLGLPAWTSDRDSDVGTLYWTFREGLVSCEKEGLRIRSPSDVGDLHDWIEVVGEPRLPSFDAAPPTPTGIRLFARPKTWESGAPYFTRTWVYADPFQGEWLVRIKECAVRRLGSNLQPRLRLDGMVLQHLPENPALRDAPGRPDIPKAITSITTLMDAVRLGFVSGAVQKVGGEAAVTDPLPRVLVAASGNLLVSFETKGQTVTVGLWRRTNLPDDLAVTWEKARSK